ncbi:MAG TPA: T9SS type A sorting domain-containing protein, partial [Chitinophagaceae bacterium]
SFFISAQSPLPCINDCVSSAAIDNCAGSRISDFKNGVLFSSPSSCPDGSCAGSVWRFPEITVAGGVINATVTIDELINARIDKIDDDAATDNNGDSKTSLLAPRISPDIPLNGVDRKGYVQFTVRFFSANIGDGYSLLLNLANLSVYQYDVDGDNAGNINIGNNGSWFRETAVLKSKDVANPSILLDQQTELNTIEFMEGADKWVGSMSALCSKTGLSDCAQNISAAKFTKPQYSITLRLGYDYNAGGNIGQPSTQFGVKFGCFSIPSSIQLPVNMYEFNAKRNNSNVLLEWATTYESLNQGFRVQRKTNNIDFEDVAFVPSQAPGGNSQIKLTYRYNEVNNFKGVSQYRIIQTDMENKIRVSETRSVAGESSKHNLIIYPNPSTDGVVNLVFENSRSLRDAVLCNMFGQQLKKWSSISSNTIVLENLIPGVYHFSVINSETGEMQNAKFVVNK